MNTKLTLRLDQNLIHQAKAHARASGKSLSQMVAEYFALLQASGPQEKVQAGLSPRVERLKGVLKGSQVDRAEYRHYLEEKHL